MGSIKIWIIVAFGFLISKPLYGQVGTFTTIKFPNTYSNTITSCLYSANFRSGFIFQSNASLNFGMTGHINYNFRFRWLAHDNSAIDYSSDADQIMYLNSHGDLWIKRSSIIGGSVLIGKTSQINPSYRLDVNGNIRANKVVVNTTGADYVFDSAYMLMSLDSLECYFRIYHHLPEIPSAEQMKKNGLDVGEVEIRMLQKIEELTRYVVDLNKQLQLQQKELDHMKTMEDN